MNETFYSSKNPEKILKIDNNKKSFLSSESAY